MPRRLNVLKSNIFILEQYNIELDNFILKNKIKANKDYIQNILKRYDDILYYLTNDELQEGVENFDEVYKKKLDYFLQKRNQYKKCCKI